MNNLDAAESLLEAERVSTRVRRSARWYAHYLLVFAAGSFAVALGYAALGPKRGAWLVTPIWLVFVVVISVYANRQRSQVRGMGRLHGIVIAAWAVVWAVTIFGSFQVGQALWWWLLGGVALALPPLVGRHVFLRRLAAR